MLNLFLSSPPSIYISVFAKSTIVVMVFCWALSVNQFFWKKRFKYSEFLWKNITTPKNSLVIAYLDGKGIWSASNIKKLKTVLGFTCWVINSRRPCESSTGQWGKSLDDDHSKTKIHPISMQTLLIPLCIIGYQGLIDWNTTIGSVSVVMLICKGNDFETVCVDNYKWWELCGRRLF